MGCISTLCRIFIIFVNIIFLIIGLVLFAGGLFLRFGDKYINALLTAVETGIEASINAVNSTTSADINLDVGKLLLGIALVCIFTGLGFIIISLSGCCGSCYKIKCFLIIYVVVCSVLLIGQVIVVGIVFGKPDTIKKPITATLKKSIESDYAGLDGTDIVSVAWNIIMQWLQCCGASGESDFTGATKWSKSASGTPIVRPISCCVELPTSTTVTCAESTATAGTYFTSGCVDTIWGLIFTNKFKKYVYGVLSGIGGFQLLLIVAAIVLLCSEMNSEKNKTYPEAPQAYAGKKPSKRSVNPDPRGRRY